MTVQFLQHQLDYIFFFYGLGFVLLAAVCVEMRGDPGRRLPWIWLAAFGLTHGINEWLEMLALSEGDSPAFSAVRLALMIVSFILLFEFGREGLRRLKGKAPGRWIYIPLLVCLLPAVPVGIAGVNAAARYAFGLTGGLWAAWTIFQLSKIRMEHRPSLYAQWAAILLAVYAVAAGAIPPKAPFWPASLVNQTSFLNVVGVPVQLVCGILAMAITAVLWSYSRQTTLSAVSQMGEEVKSKYAMQFMAVMLVVLIAGWLFTELQGKDADQQTRDDILSLADVSAASLDSRQVRFLTDLPPDASLPEYDYVRARLIEINQATSRIRWLYLTAQKEGGIFFTVDSIASDNPKHAGPGVPYSWPPQELFTVFATGQSAVVGPYTYEGVSFISGFVPLRDPSTGEVMQVLEADINAADWQMAVGKARLAGISITLLISLMFIGFFIVRERMAAAALLINASEKRLSGAQKIAHVGSWTYLPELEQMTWSEEMFRIFGISARNGAPAYADLHRYCHPRDWVRFSTLNQEAIHHGGGYELEMRVIRPDGSVRYVAVRAEGALRAQSGQPVQILGTLQDITERKRTQEEVQAWKDRYELVIASSGQLVYEYDVNTQSVIWGSSLPQVLGYQPREMQMGADLWIELVHPEDRDRVLQIYGQAQASKTSYDMEYRFLNKDGSYHWIHDRGDLVPVGKDQSALCMMGMMQDVTQRKQAEEALALAHAELEKANLELQKASQVKN